MSLIKYFSNLYMLLFLSTYVYSYSSIKDIPSSKSGFTAFEIETSKTVKPLFYIDVNNDK